MDQIDDIQLQIAMARLLVDRDQRVLLRDRPQAFGNLNELSAEQLAVLEGTDLSRMDVFARLLGEKRMGLVHKLLPAALNLLHQHDALTEVARRFIEGHLPMESAEYATRTVRDASWFADMVEAMVETGALAIPRLADVLRCERIQVQLAFDPDAARLAREFQRRREARPELTAEQLLEARPALGGHVQVARFGCNVEPLMQALTQGQPPPEVADAPTFFLFAKRAGLHSVQAVRLNQLTFSLLSECDGSRTTRAILAPFIAGKPEDHARRLMDGCISTLSRMYALDIVTLAEADNRTGDD